MVAWLSRLRVWASLLSEASKACSNSDFEEVSLSVQVVPQQVHLGFFAE